MAVIPQSNLPQATRDRLTKKADGESAQGVFAVSLTGPLVIEAAAGEGKGPRRFSGVLYNGGPIKVAKYPVPIVIDLAGLQGTDKSRPLSREHDEERLVGHYDSFVNDGKALAAAGAISASGQDAAEVAQMADNGFPWQQSIEAMPSRAHILAVQAGQTVVVNGRTFSGPILVARRSTLLGGSVVARGADDDTNFRIAASAASFNYLEVHSMDFDKWVEELKLDKATLTEQQVAALKAKFDAEQATIKASAKDNGNDPPPVGALPAFDMEEIRETHARHVATIEASFADYEDKLEAKELAPIRAGALKAAKDLRRQAVQEQWPAVKLDNGLIRAAADVRVALIQADRPKAPVIHSSSHELTAPVIEAAMCISAGLNGVEKAFKPEVLEAASHRDVRNIGLQEVIIQAARTNGYSGRAKITRSNLQDVLQYAFPPAILGSATTTLSLAGILSNIAKKFLLEGFHDVETVWREFAAIRPVSDFKAITSYRMLDDMVFEELGPDGKIQHGELSEESYTNRARTYAKMATLRREDIINDDLGAFDSIRSRIGRGSGIKLNRVLWAIFQDNAAFFTAARGNLITAALGENGLAAAEQALDAITDGKGNPIDVSTGAILLVPSALDQTARKWYVSQEMRDTTASTKTPTANIYQNKYRPVKSKYITSAYGGTATQWYIVPVNGGDMAPVEVCFLDNVQSPTVESAEADFNQLGVNFRGYWDFGVTKKEWRASIKSAGTG